MVDVFQIITDRIVGLLEKGVIPWRKTWSSDSEPKNLVSKKAYRGSNVFVLNAAGYSSPYWVSFKQAKDLGGSVKRGEHGWPCFFWKWLRKDEGGEDERSFPMLRLYTVFNTEQCEGLGDKVPAPVKNANEPIPACEGIVAAMPQCPRIKGDSRAFYSPHEDFVGIPPKETFTKAEEYYCALFHELVHSTGHASRVKREMSGRFGSESYSKEELVAEMGAAFLCAHAGVEQATIENSAAYIANWLGRLKEDKKLVILAGAAAQKATDFILDRKFETEEAVA